MFEIGFWELALVFGLALVVLGPEKLPKLASQLGRYAGQARRMARTLTSQLRAELDAEELRSLSRQAPPPPSQPAANYSRPGMEELVPRGGEPEGSPGPASPSSTETGGPAPSADRDGP
jgi:sec-independent protein translocase protein TatB